MLQVHIIERIDTDDTSIHTCLVWEEPERTLVPRLHFKEQGKVYTAVATAFGNDYIIRPDGHVEEWILEADAGTVHHAIAHKIAESL